MAKRYISNTSIWIILFFVTFSAKINAQLPIDFGALQIMNDAEMPVEVNLSGGFRQIESQGNYLNMSFPPIPGATLDVVVNLNPSDFDPAGESIHLFAAVIAENAANENLIFLLQPDNSWDLMNESEILQSTESLQSLLGGVALTSSVAETVVSIPSVNSIISHPEVAQEYGSTLLGMIIAIAEAKTQLQA